MQESHHHLAPIQPRDLLLPLLLSPGRRNPKRALLTFPVCPFVLYLYDQPHSVTQNELLET